MGIATGLIFSLFNVTSSQDVSFRQPQQLQCLHHDSMYQSLPLFFFMLHSFLAYCIGKICSVSIMASVQDLGLVQS